MSSSDARIPLAIPTIGGNAAAYLQDCLDTNYVSSVGPYVERFERAFAERVGARYAVACASGTAALHLAFLVLDVGPGDDVLVADLTFVASVNPIVYVGARPILVDAEQRTLGMDPTLVVAELERRARAGESQPTAIEVVHLLGQPADIGPLLAAAERYGVAVVEDASEALGATYESGSLAGRSVGAIGRIGIFSFNGNKLITTGGGGMVVTDDEALARRARHLSTQARLPGLAYDHDEVGYNYRLTNLAAALGLAQLEQLDELLAARRRIAARYDAAIDDIPALRPSPRVEGMAASYWLYTASLQRPDEPRRDALLAALGALGIEARPVWRPIHATRRYAQAARLPGPIADDIFASAFCLPSSSSLSEADQDRVIAGLRQVVADTGR